MLYELFKPIIRVPWPLGPLGTPVFAWCKLLNHVFMPAGRWSRTVGTSLEIDFEIRRGEKSEHVPLPYPWLWGLGGGRRWVEFLLLRSMPQYQLSSLPRAASPADVPWAPRRRAEKVCVWRGCQGDGEVPRSEATSFASFDFFALKTLL